MDKKIAEYVCSIIVGFESGLYKMLENMNKKELCKLACKYEPFITIFRDLHEKYYTKNFNLIITNSNDAKQNFFLSIQSESKHSIRCIINIVANLAVSVHFNMDRTKLEFQSCDKYVNCVYQESYRLVSVINIPKLFDHICTIDDHIQKPIADGEKFIAIDLVCLSNGVPKEINSFRNRSDDTDRDVGIVDDIGNIDDIGVDHQVVPIDKN